MKGYSKDQRSKDIEINESHIQPGAVFPKRKVKYICKKTMLQTFTHENDWNCQHYFVILSIRQSLVWMGGM